jgi:hypothetical protein
MEIEAMEKKAIESAITKFAQGDLTSNALNLFVALGYNTSRKSHLPEKTFDSFKANFPLPDSFNAEKALVSEWKYVDLLFQLSTAEISMQNGQKDSKKLDNVDIQSYLFIVIELTSKEYTRNLLAQVCREVNKIFPMPVLILFKYGEYITLSIIDRRINKRQNDKDVLEKVTLIKDIFLSIPHRAHIEILHYLSLEELKNRYTISNFVELHSAWQKTLDTKELNDRFYNDLYNWYEWAVTLAQFPSGNAKKPHILDKNDANNEKEIRKNLIRLVTRLIFVWFIKQKRLVPDEIFSVDILRELLIGFNDQGKTNVNYYNAIIQNLFFATLNRDRGEREFAEDVKEQHNEQYMIKFYFRDDKKHTFFKIDHKEFVAKFDVVPFLNGGLFECLDYMEEVENDKKIPICVDGFSREASRRAIVPNILFFGTAKNKKGIEREEGIINIFNRYVFTIEENTPIDQDIALDPELLGKVFENLLATYNPETQESARNDTGSFYTPREIVEYMVDTSLKEYFKQKIAKKDADTVVIEQKLNTLISYNDAEHGFSDTEKETLIKAIDEAKILDPACGSGAFPMGVLHKLVYILGKLDPGNELWRERQKKKLDDIQDSVIKKQLQENIDTAFKSGELDYGRKLYLIENCIFGVDIQTIAIQISKLRFFISLIVDQNIDRKKENLGILPLPNLETKFIAANTLMGLEKPEGFLRNIELDNLEVALLEIRHNLFSAQTANDKYDYRKKDKAKRQEIQHELESSGWSNASAKQIADWDPYNQNKSTKWFDAEWMFGPNLKDGFDVVIGNPPYVPTEYINKKDKIYLEKNYKSAFGRINLYPIFYERGLTLLVPNGLIGFITPYTILKNQYYREARKYILDNSKILELIDFKGVPVFQDAAVDSIVFILKKGNFRKYEFKQISNINSFENQLYKTNFFNIQEVEKRDDLSMLITENDNLIEKLNHNTIQLKDILKFNQGIITGGNSNFLTTTKSDLTEKVITGSDFYRYSLNYANQLIIYDTTKLHRPRKREIFEVKEKILLRQTSAYPVCTIDAEQHFTLDTVHCGILISEKFNLKYLLSLLNSRLIRFLYESSINESGKVFAQVKIIYVDPLPIKNISLSEQQPFINLADKMLSLNTDLQSKRQRFLKRLSDNFSALKITGTLEHFDELEFKQFLAELKRQKITLSLKQQDEWEEYFNAYQTECRNFVNQIEATDKEIDRMVYALYGLTEEEVGIVKGLPEVKVENKIHKLKI